MPFGEHHHHHHEPEDAGAAQEGFDSAGRSLSDALQVSFRILKFVLLIVGVLYLASGIKKVDQKEKALVLRLGKLQPDVRSGGLVWTLPRPFDRLITVPVAEKRSLTVQKQDLLLKENQDRNQLHRGGGLDPKVDGSIMTGDRGLVHAQWIVTYEIDDLRKFVSNVYMAESGGETGLIEHAVENAAIQVIGRTEAVDVVRHKIAEIQSAIRRRAQDTLDALDSGIRIANIDAKPSWPIQTRQAFERVTTAANEKTKRIDAAKKRSTEILNDTAGAAHRELKELFDQYLAAKASADAPTEKARLAEIEDVIQNRATGEASRRIQEAQSQKKKILENIVADYAQYQAYLEEYLRSPDLLFHRLWIDAQKKIQANPNITRRYLPDQHKEIRLIIGPDPEELRKREEEKYKTEEKIKGDFSDVGSKTGVTTSTPQRLE